jgi:predicted PolB exonuclease-like 3'-5' exonuclease
MALDQLDTISKWEFKRLLDLDTPRYVMWDIETGPLPVNELRAYLDERKIKYPKKPGEFDPSKVAYGNRTKPESRAAHLSEARKKHIQKQRNHQSACAEAVEEALDDLHKKAALNSVTNRVLAIGYGILMADGSIQTYLDHDDIELNLTRRMWYMVQRVGQTNGQFFTFNGNGFDLPIMTQKAWKYGLDHRYLLTKYNKMEDISADAKVRFQCGNYQQGSSLANVAKFLGVAGKLEGVTGDMFHTLYFGDAISKKRALTYLWHDIDALYRVCSKIGMLDTPLEVLIEAERYQNDN